MTAEVGLRRIGQIAVTVANLDRAIGFYRDALGLPLLFRAPPALAFFDVGGVRLMLSEPENGAAAAASTSVVYYQVDDLRATAAALAAKGVELDSDPHLITRMPDHDLWMAFLRDPDGNPLGLMCEVRSEG